MSGYDWKLEWDDAEEYIIFKLWKDNGETVVKEFALEPPQHALLYYALKDWFGDK